MKSVLLFIACICGIAASAFASDSCVQTNYGRCFNVHARYAVYTGDGMETLWPVGTHRLYWAAFGTNSLDELIQGRLDDVYIFGDFVVCPLSKEITGEMLHVCIQHSEHLKVVKRPNKR
jgi:hypothetical protein